MGRELVKKSAPPHDFGLCKAADGGYMHRAQSRAA